MTQYFNYVEASEKKWLLCPNYEAFGFPHITGSYGVLAARFFGLSWADWLKYCVKNGARLQGKNSIYIVATWESPNKDFLKEINQRVNEIAKKINVKELKY